MAKEKKEFKNYAEDPILAKAAYEFVKDIHAPLKRKRKAIEAVWEECQDAYRTIERKMYFKGTMHYCSNDLRDVILTIVPKYAKAIWYQDIPFELIPVGEEGEDDELVEVNSKLLQWDFRNLGIYLKYVDSLFQKAIYGTTIIKTPPHFEMVTKNIRKWEEQTIAGRKGKKALKREKKSERQFMGTDFIVTDLFDFWIDPVTTRRGMKDAIEYGDCIESICVKETDLRSGQKRGIYTNLEEIEDHHVGAKKQSGSPKQRVKRAGKVDTETGGATLQSLERGNKEYEIKECYAMFDLGRGVEPCLITVGADLACIRLQPWESDKPYLSSRHTPNGYNKEFYGTGLIETNLSNHYERNATRKQVVMARTMGLNMEMFSDQTGFQNKADKLRTAPNKIHFVKNINGVKPFEKPIGSILQSALAYETNLKAETQQSTGNTPYVQGNDTSRINDTATGIVRLQEAGLERFSLPLQIDENEMLAPFVNRCLQNNVDYRNEDLVIRLTDKKPIKVRPEDLSANFVVYCKGASELQNKLQRQVGLLKAWEIDLQAAQLEVGVYGQPLTKFFELKKEIHGNLGLSDPDQFLIDPKELQEEMGQKVLTPDMEWVALRRMADGIMQPMPILIQPGEDVRDHYEKHLARTNTEEFEMLPEMFKMVWMSHLNSYSQVLDLMSKKEKQEQSKKSEMSEVAVSS